MNSPRVRPLSVHLLPGEPQQGVEQVPEEQEYLEVGEPMDLEGDHYLEKNTIINSCTYSSQSRVAIDICNLDNKNTTILFSDISTSESSNFDNNDFTILFSADILIHVRALICNHVTQVQSVKHLKQ